MAEEPLSREERLARQSASLRPQAPRTRPPQRDAMLIARILRVVAERLAKYAMHGDMNIAGDLQGDKSYCTATRQMIYIHQLDRLSRGSDKK